MRAAGLFGKGGLTHLPGRPCSCSALPTAPEPTQVGTAPHRPLQRLLLKGSLGCRLPGGGEEKQKWAVRVAQARLTAGGF